MATTRSIAVRYTASVGQLISELGKAEKANDKVGTATEKAAKRAERAAQRQAKAYRDAAKAAQDAADKAAAAVAEAAARQDAASQRAADRAVRDAERAANAQIAAAQRAADATSAAREASTAVAQEAADKAAEAEEKSADRRAVASAALATGFGVAVAKFSEFDAQMSAVAAATGEAGDSLNSLRDAAVRAGADTQYSATEAADAITELSKAGLAATDILSGGLTGALNLAAAGQMDVGDAAETMATALAQFNLHGDQASHVADLLAAGAGKAQGSVADMGMALKQSGLVAANTGLSIDETTAALTAMANAGLIGSDAGTSLKTMLQRLTPQSDQAAGMMDELGISAYDASGKFIGLSAFAENLKQSMQDLTPEQRNAAMSIIFGSDAVRGATVLYNEGAAGIDKWTKATGEQGFAARQASTLTDNLKGDIERLGGSLDTALIQGGSGANNVLRNLTQTANGLVDGLGAVPGPIMAGVTAFGAMALLGPKMAGFGRTLSGPFSAGAAKARIETARLRSAIVPFGPQMQGAAQQTLTASQRITTAVGGLGKAIGGVKGAAAGLTNALGGPWGIALAGATVAIGLWAQKQAEAKAAADALNATVDIQTGKFTDSSRDSVIKSMIGDLSPEDVKLLEDLGVDFNELADAALKGGPAYEQQRAKLAALMEEKQQGLGILSQEGRATEGLLRSYTRQGDAADKVRVIQEALTQARNNDQIAASRQAGSANAAERNTADLGVAVDGVAGSASGAVGPLGDMNNALDTTGDKAKDAKDQLQGMLDNFDRLTGGKRALAAGDRAINDAKDAAIKAAKDRGGNDPAALRAVSEAKDRRDEAGADLAKARKKGNKDDIAAAAKAYARAQQQVADANARVAESYVAPQKAQEAYIAAQGDLAEKGVAQIDELVKQNKPIREVKAQYDKVRAAIIEAAKAHGIRGKALEAEADKYLPTKAKLKELLDEYEKTPAYKATEMVTPGLPATKKKVEGYWEVVNGIPNFVKTEASAYTEDAKAKVEDYWEVINGVPTHKQFTPTTPGLPEAQKQIRVYWEVINGVPTRKTTAVDVIVSGMDQLRTAATLLAQIPGGSGVSALLSLAATLPQPKVKKADGGFVTAYAAGGVDAPNSHVAEIATSGVRMWAEPETQGEGYIPLANDWRRPRAKAITQQIVSRFGGDVTWHAAGSITASSLQRGGGIDYGRLASALAEVSRGGDHVELHAHGHDSKDALRDAAREYFWERDRRR